MSDSEFTISDVKNNCPRLKKASVVGIWKENPLRKLIFHHYRHKKTFTRQKAHGWIDD